MEYREAEGASADPTQPQPEAESPDRAAQPGPDAAPAEDAPPANDGAPVEDGAQADEAAAVEVENDLDAMLDETKRERDSYLELAQRTRADFENYRKRMAAETNAAGARGKAETAGEVISVIDNLERAIEAAGIEPAAALDGSAEAEGPLEQGCLLTYRDLLAGLRRAGVVAYEPIGEPFDPAWHEALQTREVDGAESGRVVEVMQKGYRLDDLLLRPARVVVSE